jgi:hypothetical protein
MSDQHRHTLELRGYNEMLAEHCELVDHVAGFEQRLAAVEQMLADLRIPELVRELEALGCTVTLRIEPTPTANREFVADLGGGWQIVRTPADGH